VSTADNGVRLVDVSNPRDPAVVAGSLGGASNLLGLLAFSPKGNVLAIGSQYGAISLWNTSDPRNPSLLGQPMTSDRVGVVTGLKFSPDGTLLAMFADDGTIRLWSLADPAAPSQFGQIQTGSGTLSVVAAFSPDGRTLAASGANGGVTLWNISDPQTPAPVGQPLSRMSGSVEAMDFTRDGGTLAVADGRSVWLWNVIDSRKPIIRAQFDASPRDNTLNAAVTFSPDDHTLVTSGGSGIRFWDTNLDVAVRRICALSGKSLSRDLWKQYVPQSPYQPPCGS
jgi:WD40 repeat protein